MSIANASRVGPGVVLAGLPAGAEWTILIERWTARGYVVDPLDIAADVGVDDALAQVDAALRRMRARLPENGKVAVAAYGAAGYLAFLGVTRLGADGAAVFRGAGIAAFLNESKFARVPMSMHFDDADPAVPPADVRAMKGALEGIGIIDIYRYERWDDAAAAQAERRACEVLDTLGASVG